MRGPLEKNNANELEWMTHGNELWNADNNVCLYARGTE